MSLISDALRKARQEAANRDHGGVIGPGYPPRDGSRLGTGLVLGALIALAAILGGGAVAWWLVGTRPPAGPEVAAAVPAPAPRAVDTGPAVSPSADPVHEDETEPLPTPAAPVPEEVPATGSTGEGRVEEPGASMPDVGGTAAPDPSANATPDRPPAAAGKRDYYVVADLGDRTLTLDYLVHRPSDPFAQVNGVEVHVGSTVAGCRVEAITEDAVHLRDDRGEIVLRAR